MASTIRVRAIAGSDTTEVQALIQHPMDSGYVKDAQIGTGVTLKGADGNPGITGQG